MKIQKYMSTKEFATLARVSKHTLFHYDDIGLFSPEIKNDKNYRYYSIDQLETFDTIRILKDLGMPLKENKILWIQEIYNPPSNYLMFAKNN